MSNTSINELFESLFEHGFESQIIVKTSDDDQNVERLIEFGLSKNTELALCANVEEAIASISGKYLASGKPGFAFMSVKFLFSALQTLLNFCHPKLFAIPVLLILIFDDNEFETLDLKFSDLNWLSDKFQIPVHILNKSDNTFKAIENVFDLMQSNHGPAILCCHADKFKNSVNSEKAKQTFAVKEVLKEQNSLLTLVEVLHVLADLMPNNVGSITNGAHISQIWYEIMNARQKSANVFPVGKNLVNSLSLGLSVASKLSSSKAGTKVILLDNIISFKTSMNSLFQLKKCKLENFIHIIFNFINDQNAHYSEIEEDYDYLSLAKLFGYLTARELYKRAEITDTLRACLNSPGPHFIKIELKKVQLPSLKSSVNNTSTKMEFMHKIIFPT